MSTRRRIVVAGGGAAGYFGAIAAAEADPSAEVVIHEATAHVLAKVKISGGGRCNVTHACFDPAVLATRYPRGGRELLGPFHRFGPRQTVEWFEGRGVALKVEEDGRMFPVSDDSATIVDTLQGAAASAGVRLMLRSGIASAGWDSDEGVYKLHTTAGADLVADRLLIATGGNRDAGGLAMARAFGHAVEAPVPSLFTFHIDDDRLRGLEGLAVAEASVRLPGTHWESQGPVLVTHWGLSGPAILRLSAWAARPLHECGYRSGLEINWAAPHTREAVLQALIGERAAHPRRRVGGGNALGIPGRLWERLSVAAGIANEGLWAGVSNERLRALAEQISCGTFSIAGKSLNKEEFVTCGGVRLREVDLSAMESRLRPGLHFAGEVLDIDGVTGGYNFQAAWTTGWHAGRALAR